MTMIRLLATTTSACVLMAGLQTLPSTAASPGIVISVTGDEVSTYPAYDKDVARFGVRTTVATRGRLQVDVSAPDASEVRVNGVPTASGEAHVVSGLIAGDEVNVQVTSPAGTTNQSWVYLPDGYPEMVTRRAGAGPTPGYVALTLQGPGEDSYPAIVDSHGVPVRVLRFPTLTADLTAQPNGHWSLAVARTQDLWGDYTIEEYDEQFRKVADHRMVGHPKTDFHESILLPGGGRILMAYVQAPDGQTDSWLQEVSPDGQVLLDWNSRDHVALATDPVTNALGDYAHLNSIQVMADGNLLLSFRNLNQVMKIGRTTGAVMWRLGGRRSDFIFVDDPFGGPCLQHTARELANGDIQIFDNGSGAGPTESAPLCPAPDSTELVYRPRSRTTVYRLDQATGQARLVRSYDAGAFSQFAGSAQRLGAGTLDDHLFVGLNNAEQLSPPVHPGWDAPDAVEFDADGAVVWTLTSPGPATYRATKVDAPDRVPPTVVAPMDGAVLAPGHDAKLEYSCSDSGGSNLADCAGPARGATLSGELGLHQFVVHASDRAGNRTAHTITYRVAVPAPEVPRTHGADAMIRTPRGAWRGKGVSGVRRQTVQRRARVGKPIVTRFRVRNDGNATGRLRLRALSNHETTGRWFVGKRDVTMRLVSGRYRTPVLAPGRSVRLRLVVIPRRVDRRTPLALRLRAVGGDKQPDTVRLRLRVR